MTIVSIDTARRFFHRRRFAVLLGTLVALIAFAPALGDGPRAEADLALMFSVVVIGFASAARRTTLAVALAAGWLVLTWLRPFGTDAVGHIASDVMLLCIGVVTVENALRRALFAPRVDAEALCAAVAAYLLIGICWAAAYTVLETAVPGAFDFASATPSDPWVTLLYFSFTTLSTLGYGDVLPVHELARAWAVIEAMTGTIYLAILVARLVSIYRAAPAADG